MKTLPRRAVAALVLLIAFAACQRQHKRVIAVIPKGRAHLFWQSVHGGAEKAGAETSVEILWNGPAMETDYTGQLQIVDAMINRRVDAIVVAPIDKRAMVSVVERAASENIPVVIFDSGIDTDKIVSQVATDNYQAGVIAAGRIGKILAGTGTVAMVKVQPGAASTEAREKGFEDTLAKDFVGIRIVDKRYGMADFAKSLEVSENMLTAYPDLDGMFASNESSAVGAARALKGRATRVKLVGFDWSPALKEGLESGMIDSVVVQDPFRMGYESVLAAVAKLDGKPVEKLHNLPPRLVDRANLNDPDVQAQLNPDLKKWLK